MSGYTPGEQPPRASKVIKLNTNENPYPPSPKVAEAIRGALESGLQRYPDPHATAFRMQAAELLGVEPDWILCGNGSDDILTIVVRTFVDAGQVIRFAAPSYVLYDTLASLQGAMADVVRYEPDWTLGYRFAQTVDGLRLAILANPNSPSGTMLPPGEVAAIADALPCPLLVDEAYVDFAQTSCVDLVRTNERIMVSRTLSKSYALAGLRFGFIVAQPQVVEQLQKVKDSYNCDALSIAGATAAISDQDWLRANVARVRASRSRLSDELQQMGFGLSESEANFVWATHPTASHEELYLTLKAQGLLVRYMRFPHWGDGLRVSVGTDDQIDALLGLLRELV
ncbi:Histidinol-phosphate aminotransferase [Pirellulimonas nuda]|uniref:Histidinol-phosphate aminotransferase n=2 Tax=Pirellulimonas nuda TaxID=2528009 RepID=A0A518DAE4_9BACT|nr:Histidinol-phosphate aminotransferase [Pirellulimonas nuda]